jgi:hypothetical protein
MSRCLATNLFNSNQTNAICAIEPNSNTQSEVISYEAEALRCKLVGYINIVNYQVQDDYVSH